MTDAPGRGFTRRDPVSWQHWQVVAGERKHPYAGQRYCAHCEYRTVSVARCESCDGVLCRSCRETPRCGDE